MATGSQSRILADHRCLRLPDDSIRSSGAGATGGLVSCSLWVLGTELESWKSTTHSYLLRHLSSARLPISYFLELISSRNVSLTCRLLSSLAYTGHSISL